MSNLASNTPNTTAKPDAAASAAKFHAKVKQTWNKMDDADIKLYDGKREQFFSKLKEKQNVSREDAVKKIQEIEKDCGCASGANSNKAA